MHVNYGSYLNHMSNHTHLKNFKVHCKDCHAQYKSVRALKRHLRRMHRYFLRQGPDDGPDPGEPAQEAREPNGPRLLVGDEIDDRYELHAENNDELEHDTVADIQGNEKKQIIGKTLLGLRENFNLTSAATAAIADSLNEIVAINNLEISKVVSDYIPGREVADKEQLLSQICEDHGVGRYLSLFNSPAKLERFVKSDLKYVAPSEYVLGNSDNGKPETLQYVSLQESLKCLLGFTEVLDAVHDVRAVDPTCRKLYDINDGTFFRNHPLASHIDTLSLILYMDEFTLTSPLRSQAKTYKIMATYFQVANLPAYKRSRLDSIHLISLCQSKHVKKYGMQSIYQWLLDDLHELDRSGLSIFLNGEKINIRCVILVCSADNLGAHQLGGYVDSFSANHPCRFCLVSKVDLQAGKIGQPRTREDHDVQVENVINEPALSTVYGVKSRSALGTAPYFHCVDTLPSDIAHDLFEGVVKDLLTSLLKHCVQQKYFTIDDLNSSLNEFRFAATDKSDKPSTIAVTCEIKQTITKMWCLFRLLPLFIGDRVPADSEVWQLYLMLRDVVDYVTARQMTCGHVEVLRELISDFIQERLRVYPDTPLKPKEHFMLHYAEQFLKYGPLVHLWTLRFESKHQQLLQIFHPVRCCKNVCKTLATRHQCQSALSAEKTVLHSHKVSVVKAKTVMVRDLPQHIRHGVRDVVTDLGTNVVIGSGLLVNDVLLTKGTVITIGIDNGIPQFAEIGHAVFLNGRSYVLCNLLNTDHFEPHFHAYVVTRLPRQILVDETRLYDQVILGLYYLPNSLQMAVVQKHKIFPKRPVCACHVH